MNVLKMFDLNGKVAVVSGGAGLYGYQIVSALAQAGAAVYVASRNRQNNLAKLSGLIEQGYKINVMEFDLEDEKSILKLCEDIYAIEGKVDVLVNNAVLRCMNGYTDTAVNFERSMHANATGLFVISRAFCDRMAKAGCGSVINIGSYMGILGPDYNLYEGTQMNKNGALADYFFHKGGITNYTKFLAGHYGRFGIRANCIELGGLFDGTQDELFVERYNKSTMLGRMANDTDVKGLIVYLASEASAYMTGAIIPLDGGYSAK
ncbi:MAG: SDR family oxidoreductase [Clostridia bacterium]|nr:SDR family oxidoreductase [Clostridia bacterium]